MLINDYLKVTEENKIHIKDYDFFSSSQVSSINIFNSLTPSEREFLLCKLQEEETA
jgi:hypothetical protein